MTAQPSVRVIDLLSRRAWIAGVSSFAVAICISDDEAYAQSAQLQEGAASEALEVEEIVVTGSRIGRESVFDTLAPTVSVSDAELEKRGFTNVVDALNEIPGFVPSQSSVGGQNNLAVGVSFADMFGLGSQRTLTLIDGRRVVSSNPPQINGLPGGQQVDLNVIPLALIDRIETVGVGGAPTYGSDAIAGTVNIIMKDDFEGFELSGQYGVIQNGSDPENYQVKGAWGANTSDGRGNVALAVEYNRDEGEILDKFPGLFGSEPSFLEIPAVRDVNGDGVFEDINQIFDDVRIPVQTMPNGAVVMPSPIFLPFGPPFGITQEEADAFSKFPGTDDFLQIDESGELRPFDPGGIIPSDPFSAIGGEGLDRQLRNQLVSPVERITGMVTARYDIAPWVEAYSQMTFANTEARTLVQQEALNIFPFSNEDAALGFSIDTPFISDDVRAGLIDAGAGDTFFAQVAAEAVVDNGAAQTETFLWRFVGGLRGDFEIAGRQWSWDVSANYGQSDVDGNDVGFNDGRFFNAIDAIELTDEDIQSVINVSAEDGIESVDDALSALNQLSGTDVDGAGSVICRAVLEAARGEIPLRGDPLGNAANDVRPNVDGCLPLNVLGPPGPQDAIEWVQREQITQGELKQRVFNLNLTGEAIELPAGWVQVVAGYETRRERGGFRSDEATQIGIGRNSPILDTQGEFSTDEAFFELLIPAISPEMAFGESLLGVTLVNSLTFESSARVVDNSVAGRDTVWTGGGRLAFGGILSDLTIRGNFTQSTRSPSIQELFSPRTDTFSFADDPCDVRFRQEGPARQNRQANCEAIGLGPNFNALVVRAAQEGVTGGNPNLGVERADAWTVGGILTPRWIPGFSISADFIQIAINDRITTLTLEDQMQACFDQDPSTFDPNAGICATFQRGPDGQISGFEAGFQNAAESAFKGLQFNTAYDFELSNLLGTFNDSWSNNNLGRINLSARAFHRIRNSFSVIGEAAERTIGAFEEPKWNGTFDFTWTRGPARFFWRVEWQDSTDLDPQGDEFFEDRAGNIVDDVSARIINDGGFSYTFLDRLTAQITVDNILNREASDVEIASENFGIDEIFGRQYRFRITTRF